MTLSELKKKIDGFFGMESSLEKSDDPNRATVLKFESPNGKILAEINVFDFHNANVNVESRGWRVSGSSDSIANRYLSDLTGGF